MRCFEAVKALDHDMMPNGVLVPFGILEVKQKQFNEDAAFQPNPQEVSAVTWMTRDEMLAHPETLEGNDSFFEKFEAIL